MIQYDYYLIVGVEVAKNILIVDDEDDLREMLKEFLSDEGYSCYGANSVDSALQVIFELTQKNIIMDLIISDLNMPGGSGIELLKKIRNQNIKSHFLLLSGESVEDNLKPDLSLGLSGTLIKPFRTANFLKMVKEITT